MQSHFRQPLCLRSPVRLLGDFVALLTWPRKSYVRCRPWLELVTLLVFTYWQVLIPWRAWLRLAHRERSTKIVVRLELKDRLGLDNGGH